MWIFIYKGVIDMDDLESYNQKFEAERSAYVEAEKDEIEEEIQYYRGLTSERLDIDTMIEFLNNRLRLIDIKETLHNLSLEHNQILKELNSEK
jgi:hypothetical protein